jgi:hypothetical protein
MLREHQILVICIRCAELFSSFVPNEAYQDSFPLCHFLHWIYCWSVIPCRLLNGSRRSFICRSIRPRVSFILFLFHILVDHRSQHRPRSVVHIGNSDQEPCNLRHVHTNDLIRDCNFGNFRKRIGFVLQ